MPTIRKIYLVNFLFGLVFWYGIEKLFMTSIGMDALSVSLIATELLAITLLLDVPSGILADKWSRKYTLILGAICLALATIIYGYSNSFWVYAAGTLPYGLYIVLLSGTFGALTYDSLKELGKEREYSKVQGMAYGLFCLGMFSSSLASGFIAEHSSLRLPFFLSIASIAGATAILFSIKEPHFHKPEDSVGTFSHLISSLRIIRSNAPLMLVISTGIILSSVSSLQTEYGSLYYIGLGLGTSIIGVLYGAQSLAMASGQVLAHKMNKWSLRLMPIAIVALGIISFFPKAGFLPLFFISVFLIAAIQNRIDVEVQDASPSYARATVGSVVSFSANIILIPLGLMFGLIAQSTDIFHAYRLVFFISLTAPLIWLLKLMRSKYISNPVNDNRRS
jgi:MFS family permease